MKDPSGRIARWFTLLAEYDFQICYRAGRDNSCADFLSRPVDLWVIDGDQLFGANLKAIAHYLGNLSVVDESISITRELKRKANISWFMTENFSAVLSMISGLCLI